MVEVSKAATGGLLVEVGKAAAGGLADADVETDAVVRGKAVVVAMIVIRPMLAKGISISLKWSTPATAILDMATPAVVTVATKVVALRHAVECRPVVAEIFVAARVLIRFSICPFLVATHNSSRLS